MRTLTWADICWLKKNNVKVTLANLYEQEHCRDGSKFVRVTGYPTGTTTMRIWPK
jgi:hypothetical protein